MTVEDRWLGVEELARYLGVSKDATYIWLTRGGSGTQDWEALEIQKRGDR